jgi:DNA-binding NarL/FixJ family response regulator
MSELPASPISVAIVEDDSRVRGNLCEMLGTASDVRCVGAFASAEEALRELPLIRPKVVLMDVHLPGSSGVECVRRLSAILPESLFVMLTSYDDSEALFESLKAGASGYLLKPLRSSELLEAVRDVFLGGAPMSSPIARRVVRAFSPARAGNPGGGENSGSAVGQAAASAGASTPAMEGLSEREMEILTHLSQGYLYKEISDRLGVSYATVRTHVERIYRKLHVQSRAQAVALLQGTPRR